MSRILATVVYCSAITKLDEAMPKQQATPSPASPILRNIRKVGAGPSRHSMNNRRNSEAKKARQNTMAQGSVSVMLRAIAPPKLQVIAAPATSSTPSRKLAAGEALSVAVWAVIGLPL